MRRRARRPIEAPDSAAPNRSGEGAPASPHRRLGSTLLVQRRARAAVCLRLPRHLAVLEARVLLQEGQLDLADGAVALLGDVDLGDTLLLAVLGVVVLVAVEEADDVRVLLYRAGFAKIREPRHGWRAALDLAVQLRERHHRAAELFGTRLEGAGDLRDLLLAAGVALDRPHEL